MRNTGFWELLYNMLVTQYPDGDHRDNFPLNHYHCSHLKDGRHVGIGITDEGDVWMDITLSFECQQIGLYSGIIETTDQAELILRLTSHHPYLIK